MFDLLQNVKPHIRHLQTEKTHTHTHTPRGGQRDERRGKHERRQSENGKKRKGKLKAWSINSERRNMRPDKQARMRHNTSRRVRDEEVSGEQSRRKS